MGKRAYARRGRSDRPPPLRPASKAAPRRTEAGLRGTHPGDECARVSRVPLRRSRAPKRGRSRVSCRSGGGPALSGAEAGAVPRERSADASGPLSGIRETGVSLDSVWGLVSRRCLDFGAPRIREAPSLGDSRDQRVCSSPRCVRSPGVFAAPGGVPLALRRVASAAPGKGSRAARCIALRRADRCRARLCAADRWRALARRAVARVATRRRCRARA